MAYVAPYIDASGLHLPTYSEILEDMIAQVKTIYGADIYLETDSADYQMLSVFARKVFDALQSVQLAYNSRSPASSIGAGLSSLVKLNGIIRKTASYSTCQATLTGAPGTVITNGAVQDVNKYYWDLPSSVTIGGSGAVTVTATCRTIGAITALPGELSTIATPTRGWTGITNAGPATAGAPVEGDSELRARQAVSVALPSQTRLAGTIAAIAALSNVTRYKVFENPTGSEATDPNGLNLPGHSITCVVEGATDDEVARAIYNNRGIGCYTNGDIEIEVVDPIHLGQTFIKFFRPTYVPVFVTLQIHPLFGYTTAVEAAIKATLVTYLNSLQIYETVTISGLYGAALSVMPNLAQPLLSVRSVVAGTSEGSQSGNDIAIAYNAVAEGLTENITITQV